MSLVYSPPAKSVFSWFGVFWASLALQKVSFEETLKSFFKAEEVVIADAWVNLLAAGFRTLPNLDRKEVIIPAYACNEFFKAILLADLVPVPIDLSPDCKILPEAVKAATNKRTLALLAVNNTGVCSDLRSLRKVCDELGIWMVEDAGYTLFGKDKHDQYFGSFGHASIVNMSEGKIIPVGGAAWVVNDPKLRPASDSLKIAIGEQKALPIWKELFKLLVYRLGSSPVGFRLYQSMKAAGLGDLKAKFTSEPSRRGEDYSSGNLLIQEGALALEPEHRKQLEEIILRPWNQARQQCAAMIFNKREQMAENRRYRLAQTLQQMPRQVQPLQLPPGGMPVKLPFLVPQEWRASELEHLAAYGLKKQYPATWPMAKWDFPTAQRFYKTVYTWPIHEGVDVAMSLALATELERISKKSQPL